jgi:myo-inositol-1(or 4)-monophosphatase
VGAVLGGLAAGPRRARRVGVGEGGDATTAIDRAAEDAVLSLLRGAHAGGVDLVVVSEELGVVPLGGSPSWWVVLDPIDGSVNAARGIPYFSLSIAVADGPTMADVRFALVHDFGSGEQWTAERGRGARLAGVPVERARPSGSLDLVELSGTSTELVSTHVGRLVGVAEKVRILGSIALSLCQLAAGRLDGVVSLQSIRSVDVAAGQLLVREQGMAIAFADGSPFTLAPLDLVRRSRVVAAPTTELAGRLATAIGDATAA